MTSKEKQAEAQRAGIKKTIARVIDYRKTFETEYGKKVLSDMVRIHFMMNSTIDLEKPNDLVMAYNEGQRMVVGRILQLTKQDPYKFQKILEDIDDAARREHKQFSTTTTAGEQY